MNKEQGPGPEEQQEQTAAAKQAAEQAVGQSKEFAGDAVVAIKALDLPRLYYLIALTVMVVCGFFPSAVCFGQQKPSKVAEKEIQDSLEVYQQEIQKLHDEYMESLSAAKQKAKEKLDKLAESYSAESMKRETAMVKEAIEKLETRTAIENRLALRKELLGKRYRWNVGKDTIWRFLADGTIRSSTTSAKIHWVTLNDFEVLVLLADGSLRILQFNDDRSSWKLKYLPPAKLGDRKGARRVGESGR